MASRNGNRAEILGLIHRVERRTTGHLASVVAMMVWTVAIAMLDGRSGLAAQKDEPTPAAAPETKPPIEKVVPQKQSAPLDMIIQNQPLILRTEAYAGQPYGVGRVTFRLRQGDEMIERVGATLLTDRENRVFYPMVSRSALRTFIENVTGSQGGQPDDAQTVWFLFKGNQPLNLTLQGSGSVSFQVPVKNVRPKQFDRQEVQWWQTLNRVINAQMEASDYPPMIEIYLMAMLGRRMGMSVSTPKPRNKDPMLQTFELMFDVESLRSDTIRDWMLNGVAVALADQEIPNPIQWTPLTVENLPQDINIEPIAKCVPEECFYLRFGTWQNQLWLQRLLEEFGGDLSRMIQVRGFKYRIQSKFLDQLAIQSTEWDRLFGGNLIDDVAVIGSDTYFDNGSAVGVLLHARATESLRNNLKNKRAKFAEANKNLGATIRLIEFGDDTIEFLSTPDNRYRSFYAVSGDCHLVTTSLVIAQRFLESGRGIGSLADSEEYRFARYNMPLELDHTVFVYVSTRFLQQLLTPQYQIELRRRNRIVTSIMLLEMARMAANNEQSRDQSVEGLVREGYLPDGFGQRADGGGFQTVGDHWVDSVRGRRGFFKPIPDVSIGSVTAEEVRWFQDRAAFFAQSIRTLDPMFIAIKRYDHGKNVERVAFDARLAPFGEQKYGWLMNMLGPPLEHEIAAMPTDIIRLQVSVRGGNVGSNVPPHNIFAAVQDQLDPKVDLRPSSVVRVLETLREAPGYLGAWPNPGYTDWMPALGREPDPMGFTYSRFLNLWRLQWKDNSGEEFSVLAFDQNRLEALKPHLKVVPSERPAQVRLIVGDLANSRLSNWANAVNYRRSWQTSVANVRLLNLLTQQFRVPVDATRAIAERMLDVELVCSLTGTYELAVLPSGRLLWYSTAWPSFSRPQLPKDHAAPFLQWFRGLEVEVTKAETQFSVHGFLDIERSESDTNALPSFDMFKGFGNLFGTGEDSAKNEPARKN